MNRQINRIFLDLDGVLADWLSPAVRAHGRDPDEVLAAWPASTYDLAKVLGVSTNALWKPIHAQGAAFWEQLEPYPWVHDMVRGCQEFAPTTILTSPSLDPMAAAGKVAWMQRVLGRDFRDFLIGPDKPSCARPGAVLIDDRDSGCEDFIAAGGNAVVFPQPWNSLRSIAMATGPRTISAEGPWGFVLHELDAIDKTLAADALELGRAQVSDALGGVPDFDGFAESCEGRAQFLRGLHAHPHDRHAAEQEARELDVLAATGRSHGQRNGYTR